MRVGGDRWLAVAEEVFVPADAGGRVESLNLLAAAAAAGVRLTVLVPGAGPAEEAEHRAAVPGSTVVGMPRKAGWRTHLRLRPFVFTSRPLPAGLTDRLAAEHASDPFTAVLAVSFRVAHLGIALADRLDLPLVVRPHNIESAYFAELARSTGRVRGLPYRAEAWKLRRAEAAVHRDPRVTRFVDIADADAARRARLTTIPVAHVPPFLAPRAAPPAGSRRRPTREPVVLFLGSLDNANNEAGIRWFVDACWPALRARAQLRVVGRRASPDLVAHLEAAGAQVTVAAPDVTPFLADADVFVNPVAGGAGINIKVVDALAAGLPVVTTTVGARGLHWRPGEHLVVADGVAAFRSAVADLLADEDRRAALGAAGRRFVVEELDAARGITRLLGVPPPPRA